MIFPKSIRARLTLWYVAVLAAVLSICAVIVYGLLAQSRVDQLEARLEVAVRVVASSLEHEIEEHSGISPGEASFRKVLGAIHHLSFPDLALVVMGNGAIAGEKPDADGFRIPERELSRASAAPLTDQPEAGSPMRWSEAGRRYMAIRIKVKGAGSYLFVSSSSEKEADQDNVTVRNAVLAALPIPLLLSAAGGWWLAKKSFAPVNAMIDAVEGITATALDRRLPEPASDNELARLARTFNHLLARLENSFDLQRRFMADASHELKTPVSVAHTAAQVALDSPHRAESEYRDALEVIDAQMRRLGRVVQDMFLLARVDAGGAVPLRISKFYLDEVLAGCARAARVLAGPRNIRIVEAEYRESPFSGDELLLRQAVMILLHNAIQYAGHGAEVRLSLAGENGAYQISVADNGPGIPKEMQEKIFERFFRADKARSRGAVDSGGAGLGLPIAKWIASVHGGSLDLASSTPQGSLFRLRVQSTLY